MTKVLIISESTRPTYAVDRPFRKRLRHHYICCAIGLQFVGWWETTHLQPFEDVDKKYRDSDLQQLVRQHAFGHNKVHYVLQACKCSQIGHYKGLQPLCVGSHTNGVSFHHR